MPKNQLDGNELHEHQRERGRGHQSRGHQDRFRGDQLNLRVFAANRQLHQEAFILFWRTSHFCFQHGDAVNRFLDRLTESQKNNLLNLALDVQFDYCEGRDGDCSQMYWQIRHGWPVCELLKADSHPLRFLENLELRLQLRYGTTENTSAGQLGTLRAVFQTLKKLRLLQLKQACVTVSTTDYSEDEEFQEPLLTTEELAEIAASFQATLLNSTVTKEDQTQSLTFDMQKLKKVLAREEAEYKTNIAAVERYQKQADSNRAKADQLKEQLSNMEAALEKQDAAAMDSLLMG